MSVMDVIEASRQDQMEEMMAAGKGMPMPGGPMGGGKGMGGGMGPMMDDMPKKSTMPGGGGMPRPEPPRNTAPAPTAPRNNPVPRVQDGISWSQLFKALGNINKSNIDVSWAAVWGGCLVGVTLIWGMCCWSFILTLHGWLPQLIKLTQTDPAKWLTTAFDFGVAALGIFIYWLISRFEIKLWPKTLLRRGETGWALVTLIFLWFIVCGIDFRGVWTFVDKFMNNWAFDIWAWHIVLPNNQWYTIGIKGLVTGLAAFAVERAMLKCLKDFLKAVGAKVK